MAPPDGLGLRERKKLETRQRIQQVAIDLFGERGFDDVTVTEVARAANVSQATVFNYFPTKEDLVLHGMAAYGDRLVDTLRDHPGGVPMLQTFRAEILEPRGVLAQNDPSAIDGLVRVHEIIAGSPALRARQLLIAEATAADVAELFAGGAPDAVHPRFLAAAVVGITQAMTSEIHRLAAAGHSGTDIAEIVLPQGARAVDLLIAGLAAEDANTRSGR
ncbi:TetR family transcriptional regulator [Tsukamurella sp. 1534]|uniref:TetR family transcriptional regulator n=1 Tax=Tsukamurella sp. 1534 TaxID=1151061 RepID=UPI0002F3D803|nr:TetR family transcriptional regulator [Tsukamurella sp. 1534]